MTVSYYYSFATDDALRTPTLNITGNLDVVFRAKMPAWNTGGTSMALVSHGFFAWEVISYLGNFYLAINGANQGSCSVANLGVTNSVTYWFRVTRNTTTGAIDWFVQPDSDDLPASWGTAKTDGGTQAAGAINTTSRDLCIGARPHASDGTVSVFLTGDVYDVIVKEGSTLKFEWRGRSDYAESGAFVASSGQTVTIVNAVLQSYLIPNTYTDIVNVTVNTTVIEVVNISVNPSGIQTVTVSVDDVGTNTADILALDARVTTAEADITALETANAVTAWTGVTYQNSWVNYSGTTPVEYRKVGTNVQIRGRCKNGTIGATVFVLPVGFRPPYVHNQVIMGASYVNGAAIAITDAGVVTIAVGSNVEVNLGTIWFSTVA